MLDDVKTGVSANCTAGANGIPQSTLKDPISGRVVRGTNPGPRPYLTKDEETDLAHHLFSQELDSQGLHSPQCHQQSLSHYYG